jgi:uncharacterized protein YecE (DUF72 family)
VNGTLELPFEDPDAAPAPSPGAKIVVGTSGYSFADWVGPFYPPGTRPAQFLDYYSRHFHAVEVNVTFYRMPEARMLQRIERKTPAGFRFMVKLNQAMTHDSSRDPALYRAFLEALQPLKDAGKYDGLLAQFPWSFQRTPEHRDHLAAMRELLADEPLFAEFRHDSWLTTDLAPELREQRIGYCAVDEPRLTGLMPPLTMLTSEDAYIRFHGRNAANWWKGSHARAAGEPVRSDRTQLRYDYDYKPAELQEWVRKVAELAEQARRTYLFFNNCHAGQAARSAKLMQELLRHQGLPA